MLVWMAFPPNLFRGQRAMMHIPESSAGEAFHPLLVILPSREESLLYICPIYRSSVAIFVIITWMIELKLREENCVHVGFLQKAKQISCSPLLSLDFTIIDLSRELWTKELVKGFFPDTSVLELFIGRRLFYCCQQVMSCFKKRKKNKCKIVLTMPLYKIQINVKKKEEKCKELQINVKYKI